MQMTHKFTWNLTLGTLILVSLNWQAVIIIIINNKLKLNPDKTEFIVIGDNQIRSSLKSFFPVSLLGLIMKPA